jgi:hypothetical protein
VKDIPVLRNFMNIAEASEVLSCTPEDVRKLIAEGLLSCRSEPGKPDRLRRDEVAPLAAILAPRINQDSQPKLF